MNKLKNISKPSFCVIAPTSYLEHITLTKTHLVLAHLVDRDDVYANFYRSRSKDGDLVIMDNGAYELKRPYSPEKLVELGHKCCADIIVLPDYPFEKSKVTIEAAERFIPLFKNAGFGTFFVPQSQQGDIEDWIDAYKWGVNNPDVDVLGFSILGVPNALPHVPYQYARVVMCHILKERGLLNHQKHNHFLGLNAGPNVEIPTLIQMGVLDTCDSSGPVWAGINNIRYNTDYSDWMGIDKKHLRHVDFAEPLTTDERIREIIEYNLNLTLNLFNR